MFYGGTRNFQFLLFGDQIELRIDGNLIYRFWDKAPCAKGMMGLCAWLRKVRFQNIKMERILGVNDL